MEFWSASYEGTAAETLNFMFTFKNPWNLKKNLIKVPKNKIRILIKMIKVIEIFKIKIY